MAFHSIVIPIFNEAEGLEFLYQRLKSLLEKQEELFEIVLVNDGSTDGSAELIDGFCLQDIRFRAVHLSRNFGHQIAITAGMEFAKGDTVIVLDADLQDPPELIPIFLEKWRQGYGVVYGVRRRREGEGSFKLWTAMLFYRLIQKVSDFSIPLDSGDFRLLDRQVVNALLILPERHRYVRGLVSWVGFRQIGVEYDRSPRLRGETHYSLWQMLKLAFDGISSFSFLPLRFATVMGVFASFLSVIGMIWAIYLRFFTEKTIQGWTSIILVVLFLGGIQLFAIGVIGEYLGRTYDEVRRRPLYLVAKLSGFSTERSANSKNPTKPAGGIPG